MYKKKINNRKHVYPYWMNNVSVFPLRTIFHTNRGVVLTQRDVKIERADNGRRASRVASIIVRFVFRA